MCTGHTTDFVIVIAEEGLFGIVGGAVEVVRVGD